MSRKEKRQEALLLGKKDMSFEVWKKGGVRKSLPSRCQYCQATMEGIEGEENDH